MIEGPLPAYITSLLWDSEVAAVDLDRDRALIFERVMTRGTWAAMVWLRERYARADIAEFLRGPRARRLSPRDLAYWCLVFDVDAPAGPGGGRPAWAGP